MNVNNSFKMGKKNLILVVFFLTFFLFSFNFSSSAVVVSGNSNLSRSDFGVVIQQITSSLVGASSFIDLTDTPAAYTGEGGNCVTVNVGETGLEFTPCSSDSGITEAEFQSIWNSNATPYIANWYNHTLAVEGLYGKWFYNQTTGTLNLIAEEQIYNHTSTTLGLIAEEQIYNHTSAVEGLYGQFFYNMSDGSYNATYDSFAYNQTSAVDLSTYLKNNSQVYFSSVGIGTSSPTAELQIQDSGTSAGIIINTTNANPYGFLEFNNASARTWLLQYGTGTTSDLAFYSFDQAKNVLYLNTAGRVGIGTDSPTSTLDVKSSAANSAGGLRLNSTVGNIIAFLYEGASDEASLLLRDGATARVLLNTNGDSYLTGGNVGIGTNTPSMALDVRGSGNFSGTVYVNNGTDVTTLGGGISSTLANATYGRLANVNVWTEKNNFTDKVYVYSDNDGLNGEAENFYAFKSETYTQDWGTESIAILGEGLSEYAALNEDQTTIGVKGSATNDIAENNPYGTAIGVYGTASGGTTNWAGYFNGNVNATTYYGDGSQLTGISGGGISSTLANATYGRLGASNVWTNANSFRANIIVGDQVANAYNMIFYNDGGGIQNAIYGNGGIRIGGNLTVDTNVLFASEALDKVGIGTTTPIDAFTVSDNGGNITIGDFGAGTGISIFSNQGSSTGNISFGDGTIGTALRLFNGGGSVSAMVRSEGISFFNGGNVGIGTTAPSHSLTIENSATALNVSGNLYTNTTTVNMINSRTTIGSTQNALNNAAIPTGTFLTITDLDGSDRANLEFFRPGTSFSSDTTLGLITAWSNSTTAPVSVAGLQFGLNGTNEDAGKMWFYTKPAGGALAIRMMIDSLGVIGMGTSTPDADFRTHIVGDALGVTSSNSVTPNVATGAGDVYIEDDLEIDGVDSFTSGVYLCLEPSGLLTQSDGGEAGVSACTQAASPFIYTQLANGKWQLEGEVLANLRAENLRTVQRFPLKNVATKNFLLNELKPETSHIFSMKILYSYEDKGEIKQSIHNLITEHTTLDYNESINFVLSPPTNVLTADLIIDGYYIEYPNKDDYEQFIIVSDVKEFTRTKPSRNAEKVEALVIETPSNELPQPTEDTREQSL